MRFAIVLGAFFFATSPCIYGGELTCLHSLRHHKTRAEILQSATIRPWPVSFVDIDLKPSRNSLLTSLIPYDTLSSAIGAAAYSQIPGETILERLPLNLRRNASTTCLLARGKLVLIFPKAFLLLPEVASMPMQDGDLLFTFEPRLSKNDEISRANAIDDDPWLQLLPRFHSTLEESDVVPMHGLYVRPANIDGGRIDSTLDDLEKFDWDKYRNRVKITRTSVPVFIVHRQLGGFHFACVRPFAKSGIFSENENLVRSFGGLPKDGEVNEIQAIWSQLFGGPLDGAQFAPGDVVEVTDFGRYLLINGLLN